MANYIPKIVVLISGSGSNLQALIDATKTTPPTLPVEISHVISSNADAYGLTRASNDNIPTSVHSLKTYYKGIPKEEKEARSKARAQFDCDLAQKVIDLKPDLVVCAGWMLILSPSFLKPLNEENVKIPIINLHPALPGQFAGTHAIERSWEAGQRKEVTKGGCMIHYVIEEVDMGEPLIVEEIDIIPGESCEDWETRIHQREHIGIVKGALLALQKSNKL